MKFITLRYAGKCADCGTALPVGTRVKYYGFGKYYGMKCHSRKPLPSDEVVDNTDPAFSDNDERVFKG